MKFSTILKLIEKGLKDRATSLIKSELEEYENIFCMLVMGVFSGLPYPPTGLILRLLPHMEKELKVMLQKTATLDDAFSQTIGKFDID
ncbi:MAG: hypothetical protein ACP5QT_06220 [Brevinematia bacterium]